MTDKAVAAQLFTAFMKKFGQNVIMTGQSLVKNHLEEPMAINAFIIL